nr:axin-2-like [Oncorhynchus nerka]
MCQRGFHGGYSFLNPRIGSGGTPTAQIRAPPKSTPSPTISPQPSSLTPPTPTPSPLFPSTPISPTLSSCTLRANSRGTTVLLTLFPTCVPSDRDGIPPYKLGTKKQLQREMHRSVKINGLVSLPHFPRTHRLPKEMTPVEPSAFAAQLISRLEKLKREQDTMSSLEERLQQIQEEEERDESDPSTTIPLHHPLLPPSSGADEDAQAILDEHLSRVLKTPGCQSPGVIRHSPRSCSPDRPSAAVVPFLGPSYPGATKGLLAGNRQSTKHIHHHYIHHHTSTGPKSKEQIEAEAAQHIQCLCPPGGADYSDFTPGRCSSLSKRPGKPCEGIRLSQANGGDGVTSPPHLPLDATDRSQNVWQWILESERQGKNKPHGSTQGLKKSHLPDPSTPKTLPVRTHSSWGGVCGTGGHLRGGHHPAHPFIQDPAMPPLPPPNTLAQLEEACRRLEEVSKPPKQRPSTTSLQRDRSHPVPFPSGNPPLSSPALQTDEWKEPKKSISGASVSGCDLVVTYFFCGEEIPYRSMMKTHSLTLGHFKEQLSKKGNYRYYFKKASDEFECGAVFEEVWEDGALLPMYEGKVLGKVERMD